MKNSLLLILMLFSILASGQKRYFDFKPNWKEGEIRKVVFLSEVPWSDTVRHTIVDAKIIDFANENYTIEFEIDNELYQMLLEMFSPRKSGSSFGNSPPPDSIWLANSETLNRVIKEDFSQFKKITLVYEISKVTGDRTLKNLNKIQSDNKFLLENYLKKYINIFQDSLPGAFLYVLSPVLQPFESEESMEVKFEDTIGLFFFPYTLNLAMGDTIKRIEKRNYNIGGYRKKLSETTDTIKIWLDNVNEIDHIAELKCTEKSEFDLGRNRIGTSINEITTIYDLNSSWPIKSTSKQWRIYKNPTVRTTKPTINTLVIE